MASLIDFSTLDGHVKSIKEEFTLKNSSLAFYPFILRNLFSLQDDEIEDSITDTYYLRAIGKPHGNDRGVDMIYVDDSVARTEVHIFNCKYTEKFDNTNGNFPTSEIDKVLAFLSSLLSKDAALEKEVNVTLFDKVKEIWKLWETGNPHFIIHFCSNFYNGFMQQDKDRLEREISRFSGFEIKYHLMPDWINLITSMGRRTVNAKLRAIDKNYFEKSDGDIRALIVHVDVKDLVRIVVDNDDIRNQVDLYDFVKLKEYEILEDAFEDNVRVYLKQRSRINRNIKQTALSTENTRFFYYSNGITITCDHFNYPKGARSPVIELTNLQVVNGSQTIHALHDAIIEDVGRIQDVEILCRIYETQNTTLSTRIAEYTNSQNPVKSRDIRSIDYLQLKLESDFLTRGYFYERKKGQYIGKPKNKRIDGEKTGQVLYAFYNGMPHEAKNKKTVIFAERYDDIFNDQITADKVLLANKLFEFVENRKKEEREKIMALTRPSAQEQRSFILYASYQLLYMVGILALKKNIPLDVSNIELIQKCYTEAYSILKDIVKEERKNLTSKNGIYSHPAFFKSNRPKNIFDKIVESKKNKIEKK